jgi:hypothetical protein
MLTRESIINSLDGNLPLACHANFNCNYFLALHKDPNNLQKLCQIGIGSALCRITAVLAITVLSGDAAQFLLPQGQQGIGIPSGLDFVIHSTMADLEQHLSINAPTWALLLLDIVNMFNTVSRKACHSVLVAHDKFSTLIPFFDIIYSVNNPCWHRQPDGTFATFDQAEGFTQGCPLSPFFTCLVLHILLTDLNTSLRLHALTRHTDHTFPGDDGMGSLAQTKSYLNNTNIVLPYRDLTWFIHAFAEQGAPLSIYLNHTKTKILTSLTPTSPICNSNIATKDAQSLCETLAKLGSNSELLEGTRFLGQPLGNNAFAARFFDAKASEYSSASSHILDQLHDTQTQCTLYKNCAQATIPHLLASDVYQHIYLTAPHSMPIPYVAEPCAFSLSFTIISPKYSPLSLGPLMLRPLPRNSSKPLRVKM